MKPSQAHIRTVEPGDVSAIARLWQALTDYHVDLDSRLPAATPGAAERYASRLIERREDPFTQAFVADVGGEAVGYILGAVIDLHPDLFAHVDAGFIADIFVDPAYRHQGIARDLVNTMTAWFAEQGIQRVEWQVATANTEGIRFWESIGGRAIVSRMRLELDR
ncbi:MAG: GNAT family N-acetyltransferase [Anaerolineae bacterium]|nr:GNAT family N-acetyltransferase [Anaerolineae bacterium]